MEKEPLGGCLAMNFSLCWLLFASAATCVAAAQPRTWDFEHGAEGWRGPNAESGIVTEQRHPENHAYQLVATTSHHTLLTLAGSENSPDFVSSARFKIASFDGEPPTIYVYGRHAGRGFRALTVRPNGAGLLCYAGQEAKNQHFPGPELSQRKLLESWVRVKFACCRDRLLGKVWLEGANEPGWQMEGDAVGQAAGAFALGVWTAPRTPSQARVWFDDLSFQPVTGDEFAALEAQGAARCRPLDLAQLEVKDGLVESATDLGLATPGTLLTFNRQTGALSHLIHRASGRDFVSSRPALPLFRFGVTQPAGTDWETVSAEDFGKVTLQRKGPGRLEIRFENHPTLPVSARVLAAAGDDDSARLRIIVGNRSDAAVARIEFPRFSAPATLGREPEDDRLLVPVADGAVIEAPGTRSQSREALYPEAAFAQFQAYYDQTAGLSLAAEDPDGHCKRLGVAAIAGKSVEMPCVHLVPERPGRDVELPYDMVLSTFTGDWRDAAERYKRWAVHQPWCANKLAARGDIPQFLKEGAGVLIGGIQNEQGYNGFLGDHLERLPKLMDDYRQRTGLAHLVFVPYGWENRGTWAGIHYLPAVPSNDDWRAANAALCKQGDRVAMLTSGFWWVVKRRQTSGGPAFDDSADFERRKGLVIQRADGEPFAADFYDKTGVHQAWRGWSVKLCHGSPEARETMRNIFLDVARLGTPLVSFDQEIGGGQREPCYNPAHGHPPGYGNWMWTGFRDLCADILREGKPIQPELGLLMENVSELAIPYMATYWSRQFGEVDHGGVGARGIGLFSYLYHEYVTAIGAACVQGQGLLGTLPSAELRCHVLANNLTRGLIPGPFLHDVPLEAGKDGWKAQVSQAYLAFCKPYKSFPEYLLLGETLRPPAIDCAERKVWFWRQDSGGEPLKPGGPKVAKATVALPCVIAGRFAAADGSTGTVIVNPTALAQPASVHLDGARNAVLYRADRSEETRWPSAPAVARISLEPFGVRVLVTKK